LLASSQIASLSQIQAIALAQDQTLWHKTRQSLQARIAKLKPSVKLTSKRINEKAMLPQCNYGSQAYPLSR
jgi:hypothetical protein